MGGVGHVEILINLRIRMGKQGVKDLFGPFETQICATDHQQRCDRPGGKVGQYQGERQKNDNFVEQRPLGDAPDDRQFARGFEPGHVFGGYGGVIDHHARGLCPGLGRCPGDIIDRGGGNLGYRRHIIQKCQKSAHPWAFVLGLTAFNAGPGQK